MATESQGKDSKEQEEEEEEEEEEQFDRMVKRIGGRGNIYLVGEADGESGGSSSVFQEFVLDMFRTVVEFSSTKGQPNGGLKGAECSPESSRYSRSPDQTGSAQRGTSRHKVMTVRQNGNTGRKNRTIHCSVIIFIFRHPFIHNKANHVTMEEILRDIKARVKRAHVRGPRQALLGLVRADAESSETHESVSLLQQKLRSVFTKHPCDSIWAGHFIPKAPDSMENIKRNACRAVQASQSSEHLPRKMRFILWPPSRWFRGGQREETKAPTNVQTQKYNPESREEGIPLQSRPVLRS